MLQVREIVGRLRESRQTLMFSATLPRSLADFAAAGLSSPQLVRLDADRKLSPDLGLAFFTGGEEGTSFRVSCGSVLLPGWGSKCLAKLGFRFCGLQVSGRPRR
jgi:hypothetical protein